MISFLRGRVAEISATQAVIDVGGVGFACGISSTTASALPGAGSDVEAMLYTRLSVREDAFSLYGFASKEERTAFDKLVAVSGVGPKLALSVLSTLSPTALQQAVVAGDEKTLSRVPGVGKKTAQRLLMELKDAFKSDALLLHPAPGAPGSSPASLGALEDASAALLSMGFAPAEVDVALEGYDGGADDVQAAIKYALRRLGSVS